MKVSRIVLVLAIAMAVATIAMPAAAQCFGGCGIPFGGFGCGIPFGGCGFGFPFGVAGGASFQSSFTSTSSFNTFGGFGLGGCGLGGFGLGGFGCGIPFGGCGIPFGGCGFGSPFGFC